MLRYPCNHTEKHTSAEKGEILFSWRVFSRIIIVAMGNLRNKQKRGRELGTLGGRPKRLKMAELEENLNPAGKFMRDSLLLRSQR